MRGLFFPRRLEAEGSPTPHMPRNVYLALAATILLFYASNAYLTAIAAVLITAKWLPLPALLAAAYLALRARREAPAAPTLILIPLSALALVAIASAAMGVSPLSSLVAMVPIILTIACGYLVSAVIVATNSRQAFFDLVANIGRGVVAFSALFLALGVNLGRGESEGLSAWTDNPNTLAAILAPGAVLFFAGCLRRERGWEYRDAPFFLVSLALILATSSRASMVWVLVSMCAFWIYRRGLAINSLVAMAVAVVILLQWDTLLAFTTDFLGLSATRTANAFSPLSGREEVWQVGWELFQQRPLLGYGLGTSQDLIQAEAWRFLRHQGAHFHSSYLAALVETGIPGCVALVLVLGMTLARGLGDSDRTRSLPDSKWVLSALPWALVLGAAGHALFESWLLNAGNMNMLLFWTCIWLIHHQTEIVVRPVAWRAPEPPNRASAALPTR